MWQQIEPPLQPLRSEILCHRSANVGDDARLDIKGLGFWNLVLDAFFDVRIFHPIAPYIPKIQLQSIDNMSPPKKVIQLYREFRMYIKHIVFTPLVFSTSGGMGREGSTFYKRLADLLS